MNKLYIYFALSIVNFAFGQPNSMVSQSDQVDSILQSYCQANQPGMAIAVIQNGKVSYNNSVGLADLSHQISLSDSTVFNIASVSKQFTALLSLMAVEEEMFSLDDTIQEYLPELSDLPYPITIKQLANHTHGLPNFSNLIELMGFGLEDPVSNIQAVQLILKIKHINFKPGDQYQYGNTGFMLLAEILSRVYDKPFPLLIKERIFTPLQMNQSAVIDNQNTIIDNKAQAYIQNGGRYVEFANRQMESGSSNIYTSQNDMIKWALNFHTPKVGNRKMYDAMTKSTILNNGNAVEYGLGLQTEKYKGLDIVFHGGGTAGYGAYILHVPKFDFSLITMVNQRGFGGLLITYELLDFFFKDHLVEPIPKKTSYTNDELKAFEGVYEMNPGNYFTILADENSLYFGDKNTPLPLIGDDKFDVPFIPTSSFTFRPNAMDFRIADFTYHCKEINFDPPELNISELEKYVGVYYNKTFSAYCEIVLVEGDLVAQHSLNREIQLYPLSKDRFYSSTAYFGQLDFEYNANDKINGFVLTGQNIEHIEFVKLK